MIKQPASGARCQTYLFSQSYKCKQKITTNISPKFIVRLSGVQQIGLNQELQANYDVTF